MWDGLADAVVSLVARAIYADEEQREKRATRAVVSFPRLAIQLPRRRARGTLNPQPPPSRSPNPLHHRRSIVSWLASLAVFAPGPSLFSPNACF